MDGVVEYDVFRTRNTIIEMLHDRGFSTENVAQLTEQTIQNILNVKDDKEFENIFYIYSQKMDSEWAHDQPNPPTYPNILKIDFRDTRILGESLVEDKTDKDIKGVVEEQTGKRKFYEYLFIEDPSKVTPGSMVIVTDFQNTFFQQLGVVQDVLSDGTIMVWVRGHDDAFPYQKDQLNLVIEREAVDKPSITMPPSAQTYDEYVPTTPPQEYTYQPDSHMGQQGEYMPSTPPYNPDSPAYQPSTPPYNPDSPAYQPSTPPYYPDSPAFTPYTQAEAMGGSGAGSAGAQETFDMSGGERSNIQNGGVRIGNGESVSVVMLSPPKHKHIKVDVFTKLRKNIKKQRGGMRRRFKRGKAKRKLITKKDLGVPENIQVNFIYPNKSKNRIKKCLTKFDKQGGDHSTTDIIFVIFESEESITSYSQLKNELSKYKMFERPNIQIFHYKQLLINITNHDYVPKHTLLSPSEIDNVLAKHYLNNIKDLPSILTTDPITRYYGAKENNVFKIERMSKTFGRSIYYRSVVRNILNEDE